MMPTKDYQKFGMLRCFLIPEGTKSQRKFTVDIFHTLTSVNFIYIYTCYLFICISMKNWVYIGLRCGESKPTNEKSTPFSD